MLSVWHHSVRMPKQKDPAAVALGKKGGKARLKTMSAKERSNAAKLAAQARWKKEDTK